MRMVLKWKHLASWMVLGWASSLRERADQMARLDRIDDALHIYQVIQLHGFASLEDCRAMRELLYSQERYAEALVACEQALALDPADTLVYENHGTTLAMLGRYEEALTSYGHHCELAPAIEALMKLGRIEEAAHVFDEALQLAHFPAEAGDQSCAEILAYLHEARLKTLASPPCTSRV